MTEIPNGTTLSEIEKIEDGSPKLERQKPGPKPGGSKKEIVFARPPFANEVFTEEGKKRFDDLPGWQRHLIKQVIKHGNLQLAAKEAGVSSKVGSAIDAKLAEQKSVAQSLNEHGIDNAFLVMHLKDCLEANSIRFDKHNNALPFVDMNLKLKTLETIFKLRGDFNPEKTANNKIRGAVEDLFEDIKDE